MSLKIEQKIIEKQITEFEPRIYSMGVYLIPMKVNVNGRDKFIWVADEFDEDTFVDGENIYPKVISDKVETLFVR